MPKLLTRPAKKKSSVQGATGETRYFFGNGKAEGGAHLKDLLGGKGRIWRDMTLVPLPVPSGFTITTETCGDYNDLGQKLPKGLMAKWKDTWRGSGEGDGRKIRRCGNPCCWPEVRSGRPRFPCGGMMDTVLNIGMNDEAVEGMARLTNNERFAYDSYPPADQHVRRHGDGRGSYHFEQELTAVKNARGVQLDTDLDAGGLKEVVREIQESLSADRRG